MIKQIKSPFNKTEIKDIVFHNKLKKIFQDEKMKGMFLFYIPEKGDVQILSHGLCGHQLKTLSETISEISDEELESDDEHYDNR
jgi:hypothetical protein